ncbi:DUF4118 domain-containing protein [Paeniroseomonas aquatica]|uniref:histidine kinase n=3 Tax=Paeniroseomonas aquatica TaxID=373043 RepID=A0ABT8ADX7_9PROT|nr:DUF4118 domain-containing protein [Paeniroseomonas aquatica]
MTLTSGTRSLPVWARYLLTLLIVAAAFGLRAGLQGGLPDHNIFLMPILAVLVTATLFDRNSGLLAAFFAAAAILWFHLAPGQGALLPERQDAAAWALFLLIAGCISMLIDGFHTTLRRLRAAHEDLARTDSQRQLLLQEFRHRTRNDLQSLVALLLLRARAAPSPAAQDGLREAAEHARALARVHTLLAQGAIHENDPTLVDTRGFVEGLSIQLGETHATEGLRPVALNATAEAHPLNSERAILVGLVLNECVTNALKYAFPDDRAGKVQVRFSRSGEDFHLTVEDDGTGTPAEDQPEASSGRSRPLGTGLGTRLLRGMAAQLRGSFSRGPGAGGSGTRAELTFPVQAPGSHH